MFYHKVCRRILEPFIWWAHARSFVSTGCKQVEGFSFLGICDNISEQKLEGLFVSTAHVSHNSGPQFLRTPAVFQKWVSCKKSPPPPLPKKTRKGKKNLICLRAEYQLGSAVTTTTWNYSYTCVRCCCVLFPFSFPFFLSFFKSS